MVIVAGSYLYSAEEQPLPLQQHDFASLLPLFGSKNGANLAFGGSLQVDLHTAWPRDSWVPQKLIVTCLMDPVALL